MSARKRSAFTPPKRAKLRDSTGKSRSVSAKAMATDPESSSLVRLQKVLAGAGYGSRRACEVLIEQGRVSVDGEIITTQGVRIDPQNQVVHVDGRRLQLCEDKITLAFNKPRKVVTALSDPQNRKTISDYLGSIEQRVFHVGRLDYETDGLLLLTNDGELAHRLTHPSFSVQKTYVARFACPGKFSRGILKNLRDGIDLEDGLAKADSCRLIAHDGKDAVVEITLHEGRNRIVRRMFAALGFELTHLTRTRIGPVLLGNLPRGQHRSLSAKELGTLMAEVGL